MNMLRVGFCRVMGSRGCRSALQGLLLFGLLLPLASVAGDQDGYLAAVEKETAKVGSSSRVKGMIDDIVKELEGLAPPGAGFASTLSQAEFEAELGSSYAGSSVFYKRLKPGYQQEVYQQYRTGASISEVRELIMERFLGR